MKIALPTDALTALGHPGRLGVFRLLARRAPHGVRPGEIAVALGLKASTLSVHLATLARAGLVRSWRKGKAVLYAIDLGRTAAVVDFLVNDCCGGRPELCTPLAARTLLTLDREEAAMADRRFDVLFLCSGNSARSIMAEAILAREGADKFNAHSAGTRPYSELNPHTVRVLTDLGHDVSGLYAKHVSEFTRPDAPRMDFVFTVCDAAANEECPPWPGQPITAHWGLPDPVKATGTEAERGLAFLDAYRTLHRRLTGFLALSVDSLDRLTLQHRLDALGAEHAATPTAS
ncbi:MAG: helix-turn-helix domain-containing protein [Paracoccaceae bacterium]